MTARLEQLLEKFESWASCSCIEGQGFAYSYAELIEAVDSWRLRLDRIGVRRGDVIGLRADFSLSAIAALHALLARRAIAALIPRDRDPDIYLFDACACGLLEFDSSNRHHWTPRTDPPNHPLLSKLRDAEEGGLIVFTSGSTGKPKAALQSTERFLRKMDDVKRRFRTLAFLLFDHIAGMDSLFATLAAGGTLILTRRRDPDSIMALVESHRVEVLPTSPSFLRLLCATSNAAGRDISSLKLITYGSEPMDELTLARINARFPNVRISQKYGTTETGAPRSVSRANDSLWLQLKAGVETKVVDGVLWIRSDATILGYLNAPSPIDEHGWYCTGDLVELDGDWMRILGRKSDVINVGGEKVAPAEVEEAILALEFVSDVVVCGEAHRLMGQTVMARVVLRHTLDEKAAAAQIRAHCRHRLAPYKVPIRIEFVAEGLTSARQKAQRGPRSA